MQHKQGAANRLFYLSECLSLSWRDTKIQDTSTDTHAVMHVISHGQAGVEGHRFCKEMLLQRVTWKNCSGIQSGGWRRADTAYYYHSTWCLLKCCTTPGRHLSYQSHLLQKTYTIDCCPSSQQRSHVAGTEAAATVFCCLWCFSFWSLSACGTGWVEVER